MTVSPNLNALKDHLNAIEDNQNVSQGTKLSGILDMDDVQCRDGDGRCVPECARFNCLHSHHPVRSFPKFITLKPGLRLDK